MSTLMTVVAAVAVVILLLLGLWGVIVDEWS